MECPWVLFDTRHLLGRTHPLDGSKPRSDALLLVTRYGFRVYGDLSDGLLADDIEELPYHHRVGQPEGLKRVCGAMELAENT